MRRNRSAVSVNLRYTGAVVPVWLGGNEITGPIVDQLPQVTPGSAVIGAANSRTAGQYSARIAGASITVGPGAWRLNGEEVAAGDAGYTTDAADLGKLFTYTEAVTQTGGGEDDVTRLVTVSMGIVSYPAPEIADPGTIQLTNAAVTRTYDAASLVTVTGDAALDSVDFSLDVPPPGVSIDSATGVITLDAGEVDLDDAFSVGLVVENDGGVATRTLVFEVADQTPAFTTQPEWSTATTMLAGTAYTLNPGSATQSADLSVEFVEVDGDDVSDDMAGYDLTTSYDHIGPLSAQIRATHPTNPNLFVLSEVATGEVVALRTTDVIPDVEFIDAEAPFVHVDLNDYFEGDDLTFSVADTYGGAATVVNGSDLLITPALAEGLSSLTITAVATNPGGSRQLSFTALVDALEVEAFINGTGTIGEGQTATVLSNVPGGTTTYSWRFGAVSVGTDDAPYTAPASRHLQLLSVDASYTVNGRTETATSEAVSIVDAAPVAGTLNAVTVDVDSAVSIDLSEAVTVASDAALDRLTISFAQPLPAWLSLDGLLLEGTAPSTPVEPFDIGVIYETSGGLDGPVEFIATVVSAEEPAVITKLDAGTPEADGDLPISYVIDKTSDVDFVVTSTSAQLDPTDITGQADAGSQFYFTRELTLNGVDLPFAIPGGIPRGTYYLQALTAGSATVVVSDAFVLDTVNPAFGTIGISDLTDEGATVTVAVTEPGNYDWTIGLWPTGSGPGTFADALAGTGAVTTETGTGTGNDTLSEVLTGAAAETSYVAWVAVQDDRGNKTFSASPEFTTAATAVTVSSSFVDGLGSGSVGGTSHTWSSQTLAATGKIHGLLMGRSAASMSAPSLTIGGSPAQLLFETYQRGDGANNFAILFEVDAPGATGDIVFSGGADTFDHVGIVYWNTSGLSLRGTPVVDDEGTNADLPVDTLVGDRLYAAMYSGNDTVGSATYTGITERAEFDAKTDDYIFAGDATVATAETPRAVIIDADPDTTSDMVGILFVLAP